MPERQQLTDAAALISETLQTGGSYSVSGLSNITGYSDRHIRRTLRDMDGITKAKAGRSITYSSTTARQDTGHATPDIADMPDMPDIPDMEDIRDNKGGNEKPDTQTAQNTGHAIPDIADIPDIDTGHGGHTAPRIKTQTATNRKRTPKGHSETPQSATLRPPIPDACASCQQESITENAHTAEDPVNSHTCRSCPLSLAGLERDTIQFVIVDRLFRDHLLRLAASRKWQQKETRGTTWIYLRHLTLQAGIDTVTFYSDEPRDLDGITEFVRHHFAALYPDVDSLIARIRTPARLTRDELTVVVQHPPTIEAILSSISMRMERNGTFYLKAPNPHTPGFKAYISNNTLRCEFDCRNQFQAVSALDMRQRLLAILPDVLKAPGLFWEFITDYYNPYEHPIIIDTGVDAMLSQFGTMAAEMVRAVTEALKGMQPAPMAAAPAPVEEPPDEPGMPDMTEEEIDRAQQAMAAIMRDLAEMEAYDLDQIFLSFKRHLRLEEQAARVFLAAFAAWTARRYRGRVIIEDIGRGLQEVGTPLPLTRIADAIEDLKKAGLMQDHKHLEVCFSPAGSTLGKKLLAKWERVE